MPYRKSKKYWYLITQIQMRKRTIDSFSLTPNQCFYYTWRVFGSPSQNNELNWTKIICKHLFSGFFNESFIQFKPLIILSHSNIRLCVDHSTSDCMLRAFVTPKGPPPPIDFFFLRIILYLLPSFILYTLCRFSIPAEERLCHSIYLFIYLIWRAYIHQEKKRYNA